VIGYENVINMWISMFTANDNAFQITKIKPANVRVHVRGTSAYVMCTEEVRTQMSCPSSEQVIDISEYHTSKISQKQGNNLRWLQVSTGSSSRRMMATNIFVKKNKMWRLVHHHGSQVKGLDKDGGGPQQPTIIRIDASSLLDGSRSPNALDEFVEAIFGALQDNAAAAASDNGSSDYTLTNV
jgi:hypothetical protein